jgi:hypothetical protein
MRDSIFSSGFNWKTGEFVDQLILPKNASLVPSDTEVGSIRYNSLTTDIEKYDGPLLGWRVAGNNYVTDFTYELGQLTISRSGLSDLSVTLDKEAIGLGNVENTALSTWPGSVEITTVGSIISGEWLGMPIEKSRGGVPSGGTSGQVLKKVSGTDYDYSWQADNDSGGGGGVTDGDKGAIVVTGSGTIWNLDTNAVTSSKISALAVTDAKINDVNWSKITDTPTSISGYGITDGVTLTGVQTLTNKTLTSPKINVGSDAEGDTYYRNGSGGLSRLAVGAEGLVLKIVSGLPAWAPDETGGGSSFTFNSPLSETSGVVSIANAAADGTTKGAAAFAANDFNASSGVISIDYTNGQAASTSNKGFLSATDWNTFNNKQGSISLTTTGTSGAATFIGNTLNIPQYSGTTYIFTTTDFNESGSTISLDYTNGQKASGSQPGFLSSANWTTFNNKLSNITDHIVQGTNVTITGTGTIADPYVINATPGGGGSGTVNSGAINRLAYYPAAGTTVDDLAAITANRAVISDANGLPTHSTVTNTELAYLSGVTSAIQTQINSKQPTITTGTTAQYFRGDLSLATFPTNLSDFTNGPGYITASSSNTLTNKTWNGVKISMAYGGVPAGGTEGQILAKASGSDNDLEWIDQPAGGGGVSTVNGTTNRITSTGGATPVIDIAPTYVGQNSIVTLGTITTGVWNGTPIATAYGGVPAGGSVSYILAKTSGADYATAWIPAPTGVEYFQGTGIIIDGENNISIDPEYDFGGITDGNKTDITVASTGTVWTINNNAVTNAKISTGVDAAKLADGSVSNTEFQYISTLSSNAQAQLDAKQATLVSGTNIKSINGTSLLGSGDLAITGLTDGIKNEITVSSTGASWTINNNAITSAKILDGNVTNAKLANATIGFNTPGASGMAPNWSASTTALGASSTLNIPYALTDGVIGGIVSNTKYKEWNAGMTLFQKLKASGGAVALQGSAAWELSASGSAVLEPSLVVDGGTLKLFYTGSSADQHHQIGMATTTSPDGPFTKSGSNPLIGMGQGGAPSGRLASSSCVIKVGSNYYAWALDGYGFPGDSRKVFQYKSTDGGITWTDLGLAFDTGGIILGYGNTTIWPTPVGGTYYGLADVWTGSIWETVKVSATNIEGPWTVDPTLLTDMQVIPGGTYGGGCLRRTADGIWHNFYLYSPIPGVLPSNLAYARSYDLQSWTIVETDFLTYASNANPEPIFPEEANSPFPKTDQVADIYMTEFGGKLVIVAEYGDNSYDGGGILFQIHRWVYDGTFEEFVNVPVTFKRSGEPEPLDGVLALGNTSSRQMSLSGYDTDDYKLRVGDMVIQPYGANNSFFFDNAYFNGSITEKLVNGYASGFQFYNGQFLGKAAGTSSAGTEAVFKTPLKFDADGHVGIGGDITATGGQYTGAKMVINGSSGTVTLPGYLTTGPKLSAGQIHLQANAAESNIIGFQTYFDGTNWVRSETGYPVILTASSGYTRIYNGSTGSSGASFTPTLRFELQDDGELILPFYGDGIGDRSLGVDAAGKLKIITGGGGGGEDLNATFAIGNSIVDKEMHWNTATGTDRNFKTYNYSVADNLGLWVAEATGTNEAMVLRMVPAGTGGAGGANQSIIQLFNTPVNGNHEFLSIGGHGSAGYRIESSADGTGTARDIAFQIAGADKLTISSAITAAVDISVPDEAYDATAWNGSLEVPTKNAIRDKIESMSGGFTSPLTTNGDMLYYNSSAHQRLAIGSNSNYMKVVSGLPVWGNFTTDVRAQFTAGTGIDISSGVISATGGGGTASVFVGSTVDDEAVDLTGTLAMLVGESGHLEVDVVGNSSTNNGFYVRKYIIPFRVTATNSISFYTHVDVMPADFNGANDLTGVDHGITSNGSSGLRAHVLGISGESIAWQMTVKKYAASWAA